MKTTNAAVSLRPFTEGQLLRLPSDRQTGLILQYHYYTSFAGAGAAVGCRSDVRCVSIYPIGEVCFVAPETRYERQQAIQQRIFYAKTLCRIASVHAPLQRAYLIVRQLCLWLNPKDVQAIPHNLISQLIGVLPEQVEIGWQQYLQHHTIRDPRLVSPSNLVSPSRSHARRTNAEPIQVPVSISHF